MTVYDAIRRYLQQFQKNMRPYGTLFDASSRIQIRPRLVLGPHEFTHKTAVGKRVGQRCQSLHFCVQVYFLFASLCFANDSDIMDHKLKHVFWESKALVWRI